MAVQADLGTKLEATVSELVQSGRFGSRDEVLREGVRVLQQREQQLRALDKILSQGIAELEAGLGIPAEEVFEELRKRYAVQAA